MVIICLGPVHHLPHSRNADVVLGVRKEGWCGEQGWRRRASGDRVKSMCVQSPLGHRGPAGKRWSGSRVRAGSKARQSTHGQREDSEVPSALAVEVLSPVLSRVWPSRCQ